ncbi:MAG: serine hydrolase [Asgard group archaeon]|nr:serine hydrolase [Asgard group archaeon]
MLVEDGLLEWNKPIHNFCPEFRFKDVYLNEHVTISDILSHRTGLPSHDFVWMGFEPELTFMDKIKHLEVSKPFRTSYQYSNVLYCSVAELIEKLSGKSFSKFVQERILNPLEMKSTFFSREDTRKTSDFALLYTIKEGKITEVYDYDFKVVKGSGNINSTAEDMAKFLQFQLNKGKVNGLELISESNLTKTHQPSTIIRSALLNDLYPEKRLVHYPSYAHGWNCESFRGQRLNYHGGSYKGSCHISCFLPDQKIGIDILTNTRESYLGFLLHYHVIERLLGFQQLDYVTLDEKLYSFVRDDIKKRNQSREQNRIKNTKTSHPISDYTGKYHHPAYTDFEFIQTKEKLKAIFGIHECDVRHFNYNTFEVNVEMFDSKILVTFETNQNGQINGLIIKSGCAQEKTFYKKV